MDTRRGRSGRLAGAGVLVLAVCLGCAGLVGNLPGLHYHYFAAPRSDDAWSPKIAAWQLRERTMEGVSASAPGSVAGGGGAGPGAGPEMAAARGLRDKYFSFRAERKRRMAREFADWIQDQARHHYVADGAIDHWATLEETLERDGDDCDGLELLTYHGLRDLGFDANEVYRAIVYRPSDGQHHMVTLWFEDVDDPWVIDPTGAMTKGMPRMSDLPAWVPLKVFGEYLEYTVRRSDLPEPPQTHLVAN